MNYIKKLCILEEICPEELQGEVSHWMGTFSGPSPMLKRYIMGPPAKYWKKDATMEFVVDVLWERFGAKDGDGFELPMDFEGAL